VAQTGTTEHAGLQCAADHGGSGCGGGRDAAETKLARLLWLEIYRIAHLLDRRHIPICHLIDCCSLYLSTSKESKLNAFLIFLRIMIRLFMRKLYEIKNQNFYLNMI
jgi:hypothetical protein